MCRQSGTKDRITFPSLEINEPEEVRATCKAE